MRAAPARFRITAILCTGRSGSTLLRNELCKPRSITCLTSGGGAMWFEANRTLLAGDPDSFAGAHPALAQAWLAQGYDRHDLKRTYTRAPFTPAAPGLTAHLLVKLALYRFGGNGVGLFRHVDLVHLLRDPLAIALRLCRPLPWNDNLPFYGGARASLLPMRADELAGFAAAEGLRARPRAGDALAALPYHRACAALVADYALVHAEVMARGGGFGRSAYRLRFEDFVADRDGCLASLAQHLALPDAEFPPNDVFYAPVEGEGGIRMDRPTVAEASGPINARPDGVSAQIAREVAEMLGPARAALGYAR